MKIIQFPITVTIADTVNGTIHWEDTALNKQDIINYHQSFLGFCQEEKETPKNPRFSFEVGVHSDSTYIAISAYDLLVLPDDLKVTINKGELICNIDSHDLEHSRIFYDLESSDFFTESSTEWRDTPQYAIPIPCWNPEGTGREEEEIEDFIFRQSSKKEYPIIKKYQKDQDISVYDLLDHLAENLIEGVAVPVRGFDWLEAWEEDKQDQIEIMTDDFITSLEGNEWDDLLENDVDIFKRLGKVLVDQPLSSEIKSALDQMEN
jgi:hypothetical protein